MQVSHTSFLSEKLKDSPGNTQKHALLFVGSGMYSRLYCPI